MYFGAFNPNGVFNTTPGVEFVNVLEWKLYRQDRVPSGSVWRFVSDYQTQLGISLSQNILDALNFANNPSKTNVFATINDLLGFEVDGGFANSVYLISQTADGGGA